MKSSPTGEDVWFDGLTMNSSEVRSEINFEALNLKREMPLTQNT